MPIDYSHRLRMHIPRLIIRRCGGFYTVYSGGLRQAPGILLAARHTVRPGYCVLGFPSCHRRLHQLVPTLINQPIATQLAHRYPVSSSLSSQPDQLLAKPCLCDDMICRSQASYTSASRLPDTRIAEPTRRCERTHPCSWAKGATMRISAPT